MFSTFLSRFYREVLQKYTFLSMGRCARYMVFEVIVVGFKCYGIYGILYSNTRQTETVSILKSL